MNSEIELTKKYLELLLSFRSYPRINQRKTFLEIAGYPNYENVCSNILAFYLNPNNEHGLDDLVLNAAVKLVFKDFELGIRKNFQLYREYGTLSGNRLDILIFTESYAICIENKIFHHISGNDLAEYKNTVNKISSGHQKPIYIVLSLQKITSKDDLGKIQENHFVNITYEELFHHIKQNIGNYLSVSNINYVNHLLDFMKTIQNLTSMNSKNQELFKFFSENSGIIQELSDSFNNYKESLYQNINILKEKLDANQGQPIIYKQWIYNKRVLVHDCLISGPYKIAIDTSIDLNGWEIQLWGRNTESTEFIFNTMLADKNFLSKPLGEYGIVDKRLIYQKFNEKTEIDKVENVLSELLKRVEVFFNGYK